MSQPVHDVKVLRAIAHPVRNRILGELTATGSMRAADVARELAIPANQASFHLRQLAKYGLVEEDAEAARDRRDRVWRAVSPDGYDINVGQLAKEPGGKAAGRVFMRSSAAFAHLAVEQVYGDDHAPGTKQTTMQSAIRLTEEEAVELAGDLGALSQRWTARTRGRDDERRTYLLHTMLLPYPDTPDTPDTPDAAPSGTDD